MATKGSERYATITAAWGSVNVPPITRAEAERASRALYRKFGRKTGHDLQRRDVEPDRVRRCWVTSRPDAGLGRGWERLVHDVSHRIFRRRYPGWRPHHPSHAALEMEIATHVVTRTNWLAGGLRPKAKPKPTTADARAEKLARTDALIARWDAKERRANNAIAKLKRRRAALVRAAK